MNDDGRYDGIDAHQYDDRIYSDKTKETIFRPMIMCMQIYKLIQGEMYQSKGETCSIAKNRRRVEGIMQYWKRSNTVETTTLTIWISR